MSTKGRITYRFDKQSGARIEAARQETRRASGANAVPYFQEELKFSSDIGTWTSHFQDDAGALEQLIREADGQIPKQRPKAGMNEHAAADCFPIDGPEERLSALETNETILLGDEEGEFEAAPRAYANRTPSPQVIDMYPHIETDDEHGHGHNERGRQAFPGALPSGSGKRPAQGPSWFKVFASVAGAIATGALFGYFVLTMFTGGGASDATGSADGSLPAVGSTADPAKTAAGGQAANAAGTGSANNSGASAGTGAAGTVKLSVPAASYYMLQYGVFSSQDGLTAAAAELRDKGLAAASLTSGQDYRIYVGMASDRAAADLLGQSLTGMDVYVKQVDVPALTKLTYGGAASDAQTFFEDTAGLLAKLGDMSSAKLNGQAGTGDNDWQTLHQQWTEAASRLESGMTDKTNKASLLKLIQAVNSAAVAAGEYAKKPSDAYLWSMQTAMMNAVFIQKDWFATSGSL